MLTYKSMKNNGTINTFSWNICLPVLKCCRVLSLLSKLEDILKNKVFISQVGHFEFKNPSFTLLFVFIIFITVQHCTVLYCTVLYCVVLYCTVLYFTVLLHYCTVLQCILCAVKYCTVLYCTVLYTIVL